MGRLINRHILLLTLSFLRVQLKSNMKALDSSATSLQWAKIQECKNSLQRKINTWAAIQHLYILNVSVLHTCKSHVQSQQAAIIKVYNFKLYLPSALPPNVTCSSQLQEYEFKLCEAQVFETLEELHQALQLCTYMFKYKD